MVASLETPAASLPHFPCLRRQKSQLSRERDKDCSLGSRQESKQQQKFCRILFIEPSLGHIFGLKYTLPPALDRAGERVSEAAVLYLPGPLEQISQSQTWPPRALKQGLWLADHDHLIHIKTTV